MKILALDIETAPATVYAWGLWDQNVGLNQVVSHVRVLCFAAKFLGDKKIHFYSEWDDGHDVMIAKAHELLSEADVVMHWNGNRFDIPHLNREFVEAGMGPPAPFKSIDLMLVVRKEFKFMSNKLDNIADQLGLEGKIKHEGFGMWTGVMNGDGTAQRKMAKYNKRDVTLLEDIYEILRPWIRNHPSLPLYDRTASDGCPTCGSTHRQRRGYAYTQVSRFAQYQCQNPNCKRYYRSAKADARVDVRGL